MVQFHLTSFDLVIHISHWGSSTDRQLQAICSDASRCLELTNYQSCDGNTCSSMDRMTLVMKVIYRHISKM